MSAVLHVPHSSANLKYVHIQVCGWLNTESRVPAMTAKSAAILVCTLFADLGGHHYRQCRMYTALQVSRSEAYVREKSRYIIEEIRYAYTSSHTCFKCFGKSAVICCYCRTVT